MKIESQKAIWGRPLSSSHFIWLGSFLFFLVLWWAYVRLLISAIPLQGYSPLAWVYEYFNPESFARNFPNGIHAFEKSGFMHIYLYAFSWLGIAPENLLPVVVGSQIALLGASIIVLTRAVLPGSPAVVPLLVTLLAMSSAARDMNLANFGQPIVIGQYYSVADALRIFAIAMCLKRRLLLAAVLLGLSLITHAMMGLTGAVFVGAMLLVRPKELLQGRTVTAAILFAVLGGGWIILMFRGVGFSGGGIPLNEWVDVTRTFAHHMYPLPYGVFTSGHLRRFLPFLSFSLLLIYYLSQRAPASDSDRRVVAGMVAMMGLVVFGVVNSLIAQSPFLLKLHMHRANDLVILVGLIYVVDGLWNDIQSSQWWRGGLALMVLSAPFLMRPGFPLLLTLLLVAPACLRIARGQINNAGDWLVMLLSVSCICLLGYYAYSGVAASWYAKGYIGSVMLYALALLIIVLPWLLSRLRDAWKPSLLRPGLAIILMLSLGLYWLYDMQYDEKRTRVSQNYKRAQIWARDNTPRDALFMPDPSHWYGWRDYSRRSSFGNVREWLYAGWIYDSREDVYEEGIRRLEEFNFNYRKYFNHQPTWVGFGKLYRTLRDKFYAADDAWRRGVAARYGVDYFVLWKKYIKSRSSLPVAFENADFLILSSGRN